MIRRVTPSLFAGDSSHVQLDLAISRLRCVRLANYDAKKVGRMGGGGGAGEEDRRCDGGGRGGGGMAGRIEANKAPMGGGDQGGQYGLVSDEMCRGGDEEEVVTMNVVAG